MAKALDVNDNTAQHQERQRKKKRPGDNPKQQRRLQGKSAQVNQNSLHEGDPIDSSTTEKECK